MTQKRNFSGKMIAFANFINDTKTWLMYKTSYKTLGGIFLGLFCVFILPYIVSNKSPNPGIIVFVVWFSFYCNTLFGKSENNK